MLQGLRIEAEGMVWPLETFIDSHGFQHRPAIAECRERYVGPVEVIDDRCAIRSEYEARHVDWHSILAVKSVGHAICVGCGLSFKPLAAPIFATRLVRNVAGRILRKECQVYVVNSYEAEHCEDCQDYGEWDY